MPTMNDQLGSTLIKDGATECQATGPANRGWHDFDLQVCLRVAVNESNRGMRTTASVAALRASDIWIELSARPFLADGGKIEGLMNKPF
jgi:hypothetical protein